MDRCPRCGSIIAGIICSRCLVNNEVPGFNDGYAIPGADMSHEYMANLFETLFTQRPHTHTQAGDRVYAGREDGGFTFRFNIKPQARQDLRQRMVDAHAVHEELEDGTCIALKRVGPLTTSQKEEIALKRIHDHLANKSVRTRPR